MNALTHLLSLPALALSKLPGCAPVVRACSTSVGQKIVMAITGLSLCGFLVAHLGGNLLLFVGEDKFNAYAKALHEQAALLAIAETGLFVVFVTHLGLAVSTGAMNQRARKRDYELKESKQGISALPQGGASSWMFATGLLIFVFLMLHLADLRLKINPLVDYKPAYPAAATASEKAHSADAAVGSDAPSIHAAGSSEHQASEHQVSEHQVNEYRAVRQVLSTPLSAVVYFIGIAALGVHLTHGVRSALQSLGLVQRRFEVLIRIGSILFGWGIALGFISIIAWGLASPQ